jgi:hypothetical protein
MNNGKILNVSAKHFENVVWKNKYSLAGASVSIKEVRMKRAKLEVGNSYMLLQRI